MHEYVDTRALIVGIFLPGPLLHGCNWRSLLPSWLLYYWRRRWRFWDIKVPLLWRQSPDLVNRWYAVFVSTLFRVVELLREFISRNGESHTDYDVF